MENSVEGKCSRRLHRIQHCSNRLWRLVTRGTRLAQAQCSTLRLRLLKIAAGADIITRRVWLSQNFPRQSEFVQVLESLKGVPRTGRRFGFPEAKTDSESNVNATNTRHPSLQIRNPLEKACGLGRNLSEVKARIAELIKMKTVRLCA